MSFVNVNGKIISAETPVMNTGNRAFSYGDGLFETMRWHKNRVLFLEDHIDRLFNGMKFLKMKNPKNFSAGFLKKQITQLILRNNINGDARLRLQIFRNEGGYYIPKNNSVGYVITADKLNTLNYDFNKKGLTVNIFNDSRKPTSPISNYKTCSSLIYTLAGLYAVENKLDDCLVLNCNDNIVDALSSNVFLAIKNKIFTPPLSDGCVGGVMRKNVLRIFKKENIAFDEESITQNDLLNADEFFLTNAILGIQWIGKWGEKTFKNELAKNIHEKLLKYIATDSQI